MSNFQPIMEIRCDIMADLSPKVMLRHFFLMKVTTVIMRSEVQGFIWIYIFAKIGSDQLRHESISRIKHYIAFQNVIKNVTSKKFLAQMQIYGILFMYVYIAGYFPQTRKVPQIMHTSCISFQLQTILMNFFYVRQTHVFH